MKKILVLLIHFSILVSCYAQNQEVTRYCGQYSIKLKNDGTYILQDIESSWVYGKYNWSKDTFFFQPIVVYDTLVIIHTDSTKEIDFTLSADTIRSFAGVVICKKRNSLSFDQEKGKYIAVISNEYVPIREWDKIPDTYQYQYVNRYKYLLRKGKRLGIYRNGRFIEVVKRIRFVRCKPWSYTID